MNSAIFVHMDTTSNVVLTRGLHADDFQRVIIHRPNNLLLLNPAISEGEFETHTGLKVIRGHYEVEQFFQMIARRKNNTDIRWIDFTDLTMVKELTPLEISELLYLGHMKTHLHSPFFYKLQNDFVYFDMGDDLLRVYYRYIDEFYRILAKKITAIIYQEVNDQRPFFRRKLIEVPTLPIDLVKELRELLKDGLAFNFPKAKLTSKAVEIPLYAVEEAGSRLSNQSLRQKEKVGTLTYLTKQAQWQLAIDPEWI
ncbi:hypothetical protein [Enterococcus columbae]|uniref:Uncharacterized protein n=1 Tax=Enterococcus columbae DSM 7374 = ATCC 51263 TaxID=1121865 RepID=S1N2Z5_9ENTE|nr:hypothetical protein [Enterococcus columbae]EOT39084.1 hypothetical protein OMW_01961 [Enterococcus columbae DSM 7374 = ATCC 51263]EOW79983.1 hypothetical protein I568_02334 [Enterococcus columbae DSM 7374 = ATCC 51263]